MANGKFESALTSFIPTSSKEWKQEHVALLNSACEIDRLTRHIQDDSLNMARRFEAYAKDISVRGSGWDPTGYSTIRDIAMNTAKLEAEHTSFRTLARLVLGKDKVQSILEIVADS